VARHIGALPPVSSLFAALLGVNPVRHLLALNGALAALPASARQTLTGREFFPSLISAPFHQGLAIVFATGAGLALLASIASLLRGGRYIHPETPAPVPPQPVPLPAVPLPAANGPSEAGRAIPAVAVPGSRPAPAPGSRPHSGSCQASRREPPGLGPPPPPASGQPDYPHAGLSRVSGPPAAAWRSGSGMPGASAP